MAWWRPLLKEIPVEEPLVRLDSATGQYMLNRVDERCVFLDSDNLCIVHKAAGIEAKPITCRLFPLHVVQTPDGVIDQSLRTQLKELERAMIQ